MKEEMNEEISLYSFSWFSICLYAFVSNKLMDRQFIFCYDCWVKCTPIFTPVRLLDPVFVLRLGHLKFN